VAIEGLSIRLYFDHNADPGFARDLRQSGFDAVAAKELGRERVADEDHLQWATEQGRAVFTHDLDDFPVLAQRWTDEGQTYAGIVVCLPVERLSYGEILRRLLRLLETLTADDMVNRVEWLDRRWSADEDDA
jgi:predicted nuclease of predicted toxin-antitoxin system